MSAQILSIAPEDSNSQEYPAFSYTPPTNRTWYENWPLRHYRLKNAHKETLELLEKVEIDFSEDIKKNLSEGISSSLVDEFIKASNLQIVEKIVLPKLLGMDSIQEIIRYHPQTSQKSDKWIIIPREDFNPAHALEIINDNTLCRGNNSYTRIHSARLIVNKGQDTVRPGIYTSIGLGGASRTTRHFNPDHQKKLAEDLENLRFARSQLRPDDFIITPSMGSNSIQFIPAQGSYDFSAITEREYLTQLFLEKAVAKGIDPKREFKIPSFGPSYEVSVLRPS